MDVPKPEVKSVIRKGLEAAKAGFNSAGNRKRWSTRNTVSGVLTGVVAEQALLNGLTWEGVALAFCAVLPLALSVIPSRRFR